MNWHEQALKSHYQTAVAIGDRLDSDDVEDARIGVEELIEALFRAERRALRSQVIGLMTHIIKWQSQPERRSRSWVGTIQSARGEIDDLQEDEPSLTDGVIEQMWDKCFHRALAEAEGQMGIKPKPNALNWIEVFETEYQI